ncbi:MAG: hypothetical protein VB858_13110, partial [Planctomycetaceae bacterium]
GLESLTWHELPPSLGPKPEFTTLELVAVKGGRSVTESHLFYWPQNADNSTPASTAGLVPWCHPAGHQDRDRAVIRFRG